MTDTSRHITFDPAFPIANLVPGHKHPFYPANPRKGGHEVSLPELQRSIHDQGILQPLRIFTDMHADDGKYWVHVGERRLLAAQTNLAEHPDAVATAPVLIIDGITPQEAFQESLTEQLNRLPLHPIDQFEAFAELQRGGMSEAQIASHYGIGTQVVRQRIALGKIAPKILQAWRGGAIDEACAREFTRLSSHKDQEKLFDRQRKSHGLHASAVRAVLVPDQGDGARLVNFVGLDAYRERGGEIREDLFNGVHGVSDAALASTMATERLEAECLRLTSMEGWAWAKPIDAMPAAWQHYDRSTPKMDLTPAEQKRLEELRAIMDSDDISWDENDAADEEAERIEMAARFRAFTDRQKKKCGCVLSIDQDGRLKIDAGVILPAEPEPAKDNGAKPAAKKAAAKADAEAEPEKAPSLSYAQTSDLAVTLTEAAAMVVMGNFNLAMCVALAAFAANSDGLPAHLYHRGMGSNALKLTGTDDFAKNLTTFLKMKPQQREGLFAQVVAASLQFRAASGEDHAMKDPDIAALINAVDPKVMLPAIHKRFDAGAYFERAPKALGLAAIKDCFGNGAGPGDTAAKAEVVAYASENCGPAKWLPAELRPAGYAGPGAKPAAKAKKAVKAKGRARK